MPPPLTQNHKGFKLNLLTCFVLATLPVVASAAGSTITITDTIKTDKTFDGEVEFTLALPDTTRFIVVDDHQHVKLTNGDPNGVWTFTSVLDRQIYVGKDASLTFDVSKAIFNHPDADIFNLAGSGESEYTDVTFTGDVEFNDISGTLMYTGNGNPSYPKGIRFDVQGNLLVNGGALEHDTIDGSYLTPIWLKYMSSFHAGSMTVQNLTFSKQSNAWGTNYSAMHNWGTDVRIDRDLVIDNLNFAGKAWYSGGLINEVGIDSAYPDAGRALVEIGGNVRISGLKSTVDNSGNPTPFLFGVNNEGGGVLVTGDVAISTLEAEKGYTIGLQNVTVTDRSETEFRHGDFSAKSLTITDLSNNETGVYGIYHSSQGKFDVAEGITIANLNAPNGEAIGLEADNLVIDSGLIISNIQGQTAYAVVADPTADDGIAITTNSGVVNRIEGDMATAVYVDPDSTEVSFGKLSADFNGVESGLTGGTDTSASEATQGKGGILSLSFANKAKWTVTKNSTLTSLNMDKGVLGVDINLTDGAQDGTTQVDVQGDAKGTFDVALNITGQAGADFTKSEDWFLQQTSGVLSVGDVTYQNGGALAYSVAFFEDGAAPDAEGSSTSTGNKGQWHVVLAPEDPGEPDVPPVTPEVEQALVLGASVNQGLGMLSETEDLRMRMGDIRNGDTDGLWVRTYARKDSAHGSFGNGFEQDTYGIHLGADHVVKSGSDASWLFGGAFHYGQSDMDGTADAAGGSADVDQYTFKAYATYMKDNGAFVDMVLHAGYYDTELTGLANSKMAGFKADYSNWGYGVSAEAGHRFEFGETASAWYVEPTAQLTWFHAEGKDFTTSTGLAVSQGDADFITGRLGAAMGKTFALGTDSDPMASYFSIGLKGGMLYQFDGDQTITAHGTDGATVHCDAMDLKGARAYYGLTADWKIDDAWRVYGQISREEGSGYTKDFDASIGVRYAF